MKLIPSYPCFSLHMHMYAFCEYRINLCENINIIILVIYTCKSEHKYDAALCYLQAWRRTVYL